LLDALIQLQKQIRTESIVDRKKRAAEHVPRVVRALVLPLPSI
jgi:hypothetical protein